MRENRGNGTLRGSVRKNAVKRNAIAVFAFALGLFGAVIYLNEAFWNIDWIPKWHKIYEVAGLRDAAYNDLSEGEIAVHFVDVGQGDCAVITAHGSTVLIDGGEVSAMPTLISYLRSLEVSTLDYVIATHPHSDHIGSLSGVIDEFGAKTLIMPELSEEKTPVTGSYRSMLRSAEKCGADIRRARVGDVYETAEGCFLQVLAPLNEYEDLNDCSIVLKFTYGETSFLFTGDITKEAERDIYDSGEDISADVIKVAHHGSSSSSLKVFLQAVSPEYAVISVGAHNDYGHPHKKTLELFGLLGIEVYRTDRDKSVTFVTDGSNVRVNTARELTAA